MGGSLEGLSVVDLTATLTGAHISQTLADFGADVVQVEPRSGSPLRRQPAWPFWARGKRSVVLDLAAADDRRVAQDLAARADVVVETWRPGVAERLGLGDDEFAEVDAEVTEIVEASLEFAKNGTDPAPEDALKNVYA